MASTSSDTTRRGDDSTPLNILLNAITGNQEAYPYPDKERPETHGADETGHLVLDEFLPDLDHVVAKKRKRNDADGQERQNKIARSIASIFPFGNITTTYTGEITSNSVSMVQLWHPRAAQKSYGKEKRLLNPPPVLRITGPLLDQVTGVTLSTSRTSHSSNTSDSAYLSSQSHHIPLLPIEEDTPDLDLIPLDKKAQREADRRKIREQAGKQGFGASLPWIRKKKIMRERQVLTDGLTFPGLWVGEAIGKEKEFQLELRVSQLGESSQLVEEPRPLGEVFPTDPSLENGSHQIREEMNGQAPSMDDITAEDLERIGGGSLAELPSSPRISVLPDNFEDASTRVVANIPVVAEEPTLDNWGTFSSGPLAIVSKPSQKTARARSMAGCLTEKDHFALSVRINGQTVRTKYMKLEERSEPRLASRTGIWSPFRFEVIHRAKLWRPEEKTSAEAIPPDFMLEPDVLTYGSVVSIVDSNTGCKSDPVKIVHVDKNEVVYGADVGHPVSELHRVGFVRWHEHEEPESSSSIGRRPRLFLSAPGARVGGGELLGHRFVPIKPKSTPKRSTQKRSTPAPTPPLFTEGELATPTTLEEAAGQAQHLVGGESGGVEAPEQTQVETVDSPVLMKKKQRRTKRIALAQGTLDEEDENSTTAELKWHQADGEEKDVHISTKKGQTETRWAFVERVEDWMCWIITSVECLSYRVIDDRIGNTSPAPVAIDPIPRLLATPILDRHTNTCDLLLHSYSLENPLELYLGSLGPLPSSVWKSSAPAYGKKQVGDGLAIRIDGHHPSLTTIRGKEIFCSYPSDRPHALLVVELPNLDELLRATSVNSSSADRESVNHISDLPLSTTNPAQIDTLETSTPLRLDHDEMDDSPWLAEEEHIDASELTIQEALRNAEVAFNEDQTLGELTSTIIGDTSESVDDSTRNTIAGLESATHVVDQEDAEMDECEVQERQVPIFSQSLPMSKPEPGSQVDSSERRLLPLVFVRPSDNVLFAPGVNIVLTRNGPEAQWEVNIVMTSTS